MNNTYQIKSTHELSERIECMHEINNLLTRSFAHAFNENDEICKAVAREIKRINKELNIRFDY